ncbi:MAG: arginyl-tRNA--protein-N-Asp/Glu arginylyltransferase [Alphaproteobacteria bacterium]|jgi:arginyl-tRNA--protein-N-Asp/Glu arginylyltransferase
MNRPIEQQAHRLFMGTRALPCPYLPGKIERKVVTDLSVPKAMELYERLSRGGFRRSHSLAYRPACPGCSACVPVRIRTGDFVWSRTFRRLMKRNADLTVTDMAAHATMEQFRLFTRYQRSRHTGGEMSTMGFRDYRTMVEDSPIDTRIIEFRDRESELVGVMLADRQLDALSAVYSMYDPDEERRSLGTWMVLWMVKRAAEQELPFVYLGYWIEQSPKMAYKARFRPLEGLGPDGWDVIAV